MSLDRVRDTAGALERQLNSVVRGQAAAVSQLVTAFLMGGHILLEGPPGLGKTLLVQTMAKLIQAKFARIQFTPDLMPADVTGTAIYRPATGEFEFRPGPIFAQVVLADEINRTPPKTQAALLEAMQEHQVTVDGVTHKLTDPFFVAATQNPIEYEGTYPLPEAQLDRFVMRIRMGYPEPDAERAILDAHSDSLTLAPPGLQQLSPLIGTGEIHDLRTEIAKVFTDDSVKDYIVRLIGASRKHRRVFLGGSSRAAVSLLFAAKTVAACESREFVRPDDVKGVCPAVLRHRLVLRSEAEVEGIDSDGVISDLLSTVEVHDESR